LQCLQRRLRLGHAGHATGDRPERLWYPDCPRGRGSVGRASPCQGEGRGFESRRPLHTTRHEQREGPRSGGQATRGGEAGRRAAGESKGQTDAQRRALMQRRGDARGCGGGWPVGAAIRPEEVAANAGSVRRLTADCRVVLCGSGVSTASPERAICASVTRSRHHTAWAGALAAAAELSRREYDAAITLGNTPTHDLVCSSPGGTPFTVQVKSVASKNWILIQKSMLENPSPSPTLYFVVVLVPS